MAKITRYNGNLEAPASAALGTERTIFGTGSQSDDLTDQFNAFLLRGWGIVGPSDQPTLQDFNAMGFTLGQIHAYLHQMGVAEYNATQEYHLGSITNVAGMLYVSLVDNNVGNTPASSPTQWSAPFSHGMVVLTTTQSWPVPLAMQLGYIKPFVTVYGGGGGGAHSETTTLGGGGGGGGGAGKAVIDLFGVTTVSVTIGAGGAGKASGSTGGGAAGGTSSFGAFISCTGGSGGSTPTAGDSGTPTGGQSLSISAATCGASNGAGAVSGSGGGAGGGGAETTTFPLGRNGKSPGGGGAGGGGTTGTRGGGNGAAGVVIIEW